MHALIGQTGKKPMYYWTEKLPLPDSIVDYFQSCEIMISQTQASEVALPRFISFDTISFESPVKNNGNR